MKHFLIKPSKLAGKIAIPPSKSQSLRAILFGALGRGKTTVFNYLDSPDIHAMIAACRSLGAVIETSSQKIVIEGIDGAVSKAEDVINAGNSGIVLRMISAVAALGTHPIVITGDHSIRHQRPIEPLMHGLRQLGASTISTRGDGFAPVIIQGPLKAGKAVIDGTDSQPVSSLLIAGIFAPGPIELEVFSPGEKPWAMLTVEWLQRLGISCIHHDCQHYRLEGKGHYPGFEYHVPGDLSSAAFPIAAALVTQSEVTLHNVDLNDSQGDKKLIQVFQEMGAQIEICEQEKTLHVKGGNLKGIEVDINEFVDAITILSTVACYAEGETRIRNAAVARQKECDRISCITKELRKMGASIQEFEDGLTIKGSQLKGTNVHSHEDHRMAMSLAVAGLGAHGMTHINAVDCVSKTFPTFAQQFCSLNAQIEVQS